MKRNITLKTYAMSVDWPNPRYHQQTSSGKGVLSAIVYWKGQSTELQGSRSDFEKIISAIRDKSFYDKKWCSVKYEDGLVMLGSHYILWDEGVSPAVTFPYEVALQFAMELEAVAREMELDDSDGVDLVQNLDQAFREAEETGVRRCPEGDISYLKERLSREPRSSFYKASPRDSKMSRSEIEYTTKSLLSAVEKQKARRKQKCTESRIRFTASSFGTWTN
jgi:hypothetical protein